MTTQQISFASIDAESDLEAKLLDQARSTFREYVTQKIDQGEVASILDDCEGEERDQILHEDVIVDTAEAVAAAADPGRLKGAQKASLDAISFDPDAVRQWAVDEMTTRVRTVADECGEDISL